MAGRKREEAQHESPGYTEVQQVALALNCRPCAANKSHGETESSFHGEKLMWILLETAQTKKQHKKIYFKGWARDGLDLTDDLNEAHRFDSEEEAKMSAAYRHSLSFFEPVELVMTVKNKAA